MCEELDKIFDDHLTVSGLTTQQETFLTSFDSDGTELNQEPSKNIQFRKKICSPEHIEAIKRTYDINLQKLKEHHIEKEQVIKKANDLKYKNYIWEVTTKHFNKGIYENDLLPLFRMSLAKHEMKLKRELSILQAQQRTELRQLKDKEFEKEQQMPTHTFDPSKFAKELYQRIFIKFDAQKEGSINSILNDILDKLEDDRNIIFSPRPRSPALRKIAPKDTDLLSSTESEEQSDGSESVSIQVKMPSEPKLRPEVAARVRRHNKNREKLEKELTKTDKILRKMKEEAINDVFFPQLSPLLH